MELYKAYRPSDFDQIFGNQGTINTLKAFAEKDNFPHATMYYGPTGCGKTTFGKIQATYLGCPPAFEDGTDNPDFMEVNSSNNRGIDTARDISDLVHNLPMACQSRVILLDEVHMTTKEFQNALLKVLEDTPSHVYFILCTTAPESLTQAMKNRCTHLKVNPLSDKDMTDLINGVAGAEGGEVEETALKEIIAAAEGSPRQSLVILEQILALPLGEQAAGVVASKGASMSQIIDLCRAINRRDGWSEVAAILKGLDGADPEHIRRTVLKYFNSVLTGSKPQSNGGKEKAKADYAAYVIRMFKDPFFYSGHAGASAAAYLCVTEE